MPAITSKRRGNQSACKCVHRSQKTHRCTRLQETALLPLQKAFPFVVEELPGNGKSIRYEVVSLLGEGRWGIVYRARITTLRHHNRLVALKVVRDRDGVRILRLRV
jgi:hypothetical protein